MRDRFEYELAVTWQGNRGTGTSGTREFTRDVLIEREGKPSLSVSADHHFHGDPERMNPEELLLAALSTCHMLSYFFVAVKHGCVVTSYRDAPRALLHLNHDGSGAMTAATLRPRITVASEDMLERAYAAHQEAAQLCFIGNSVNFPVALEPEVTVDAV